MKRLGFDKRLRFRDLGFFKLKMYTLQQAN